MVRIRTATHLQVALDDEFSWRVNEIANLRSGIVNSSTLRRIVLMRAAVPLAYAHWEGFVKRSATFYASYLSELGLRYSDIKPCFIGLGVMSMVQTLESIKRKLTTASSLVARIRAFDEQAVSIKLWQAVEDIGNLDFALFSEISDFLAINSAPYATKKVFIDERLIATRNRIAHGERLEVDEIAVFSMFDEVIGLLRAFKTDIENGVTMKLYLA